MAAVARAGGACPSAQELMRDPAFATVVNEEWEETKDAIKDSLRGAGRRFKGDIPDRFEEALRVYIEFEKYKKDMQWDNAFYFLHLYLEIVLEKRLHRSALHPIFAKFCKEVHETLDKVPGEMDLCMRGIRTQIIEKHRRKIEDAIRAGAPLPIPIALGGTDGAGASAGESGKKRYSLEQARHALDALRIDGRKTSGSVGGLYAKDVGGPSSTKPIGSAALAPPGPPPAYRDIMPDTGGSGLRSTHSAQASMDARTKSLRVKSVLGDGSCAFRSIAQGQARGQLSPPDEQRKAAQLRQMAASELSRCADEEMTGTGLTVEQIVLMKDDKFPTFGEYINAMSRSEYAGETEFWLLSRRLGLNIAIYQPDGSSYKHLITYGEANSEPVRLLWRRGQSEAGNHYDCLLPA